VEQVFFPLDEKLELQPGSVTPLQLKYLVHFASFHSFEEAAQMLLEHHGVQVSASTVRRQTEDVGAAAEAVQDEKEQKSLCRHTRVKEEKKDKKADKMLMSSDGSFVSLVGKRVAEVKTMVIGEVKENEQPFKQRLNQEVKTTAISYFSRMKDSATFITLVTRETERRGLFQAKRVCAVQDGAEWIQECIDAHRPDAVRILDFYHAAEYVSDIATLVRSAGTTLPESWLDEQLHETFAPRTEEGFRRNSSSPARSSPGGRSQKKGHVCAKAREAHELSALSAARVAHRKRVCRECQ
jgi:hypothetical protein